MRSPTCFTDTRFGGNQLAVLPEAEGLSDRQMQLIAREFNFSESTFVLPAEAGHACKIRIFTPTKEVPFAGHPTIGTAFVLARAGVFGALEDGVTVVFEEQAGLVPVVVRKEAGGAVACELDAPGPLALGPTVEAGALAAAISVAEEDVVTAVHPVQVASAGLPFVVAQLADRGALARARPDTGAIARMAARNGVPPDVFVYVRDDGFWDDGLEDERAVDARARMFAPLDNIPEDPATGSASCALAGLLAHVETARDGRFRWRIAQGVEMGRPSLLDARAEKRDGVVVSTGVGGSCVLVSEGMIEVGDVGAG